MASSRRKKGPPPETSDSSDPSEQESQPQPKKAVDPLGAFFSAILSDAQDAPQQRQTAARACLQMAMSQHSVADQYNVLLLFDESSLVRSDADHIYRAIRAFPKQKDILLLLHSTGGEIAPAYLISQLCREHCKSKFVAVVPRQAKSAATLLACGADQIHLGSMSELGPIDPQIGRHPALGLGNALRHIAQLVSEFPDAANMFAEYLARTVAPIDLGYYERVVESAMQYAERLLQSHAATVGQPPEQVANALVYSYKDHGFVIDKHEAVTIFGADMIVTNSPEYQFGNALYDLLAIMNWMCGYHGYQFYWVGSPTSDCNIYKTQDA